MNLKDFQNPSKEYRELPFWSWNDDLDPEELRRQVALMDEAGWGGFFMHSRIGLVTPYLGRSWMDCIKSCVNEARQRGLGAWLYDEDMWPSGFAGGLSLAGHPEYRQQCLVCKVDNRPALVAERIATFAAREVEGCLIDIRPVETPDFITKEDRLIQFYPRSNPLGDPWYNDYTYINLLNPEAVQTFLASTHEAYAREVGGDFGGAIPGFFTDEPNIRAAIPNAIPWVGDFSTYFQERNGYDLLPALPALFFDVGDYHRIRFDYWRTVTRRFVESFTRPVYHWCQEHGLAYTGHYLFEDTLRLQVENIGAAMFHYPYMHIPGIDKLGRNLSGVLTVKQLDSVVCQTGKPRALCENYGCCGQDFSHAGRKWIGDWAYVLGVNLNNPHLALYSMRGERKRDYPQDLFYQQPWWPDNHLLADYFARLSYALSQGQRAVDIAVVHPIGSAWAVYTPLASRQVDRLDSALSQLCDTLMQSQRDFHFIDETLIEPGQPCEALVKQMADGPHLQVGKMSYRLVIVPPGVTLSQNTVSLLDDFAANGGSVLAIQPYPFLVDGRAVERPVLPLTTRPVTIAGLSGELNDLLPFDLCVHGHPKIWAHHRHTLAGEVYFLANTDLCEGESVTVYLRGTGRLEEWDPATGLVHELVVSSGNGLTQVGLDFPPTGSHLLVLHPGEKPETGQSDIRRVTSLLSLADTWDLELIGPNALTLDTPQVRLEKADFQGPMDILNAQDLLKLAGTGTVFALRFSFMADCAPQGSLYLVLECPERFTLLINGQSIVMKDCGWWVDISFLKVDITGSIRSGQNEILLEGQFTRDSELESVYLLGDFGVSAQSKGEENRYAGQTFDRYAPEFRLSTPPRLARAITMGVDLTRQGLPFFAGRVILSQFIQIEKVDGNVYLELNNLHAAVAHVWVNGMEMGAVAWPPYRVEITPGLQIGENRIEVELAGTLRNLLGPHHSTGGDLDWTGPEQFHDPRNWTEDYILVPFGFGEARISKIDQHGAASRRSL